MAKTTPKGKLSEAMRLRQAAERQLERAAKLEGQLIAPTRNKLRDLMCERVDQFLRDRVQDVPAMKFSRENFAADLDDLLVKHLEPGATLLQGSADAGVQLMEANSGSVEPSLAAEADGSDVLDIAAIEATQDLDPQ